MISIYSGQLKTPLFPAARTPAARRRTVHSKRKSTPPVRSCFIHAWPIACRSVHFHHRPESLCLPMQNRPLSALPDRAAKQQISSSSSREPLLRILWYTPIFDVRGSQRPLPCAVSFNTLTSKSSHDFNASLTYIHQIMFTEIQIFPHIFYKSTDAASG